MSKMMLPPPAMRLHRAPLLLFIVPVGVYVTVLLVLAFFVLHPPALGWIGLGVAAALALGIAGIATKLFTRMRVNADRLHPQAGPAVFWESTRACLLACRHCRASAVACPMSGELDGK